MNNRIIIAILLLLTISQVKAQIDRKNVTNVFSNFQKFKIKMQVTRVYNGPDEEIGFFDFGRNYFYESKLTKPYGDTKIGLFYVFHDYDIVGRDEIFFPILKFNNTFYINNIYYSNEDELKIQKYENRLKKIYHKFEQKYQHLYTKEELIQLRKEFLYEYD